MSVDSVDTPEVEGHGFARDVGGRHPHTAPMPDGPTKATPRSVDTIYV